MKKRILFLITSLAGGGAEKVLVNMVNRLDKNKYDVTVQCLFDVGVNKQYLSPDVRYQYVFKHVIRGNSMLFKIFSPEYLYKFMVKEKYDVLVSYFQSPTTRIVAGCSDKSAKLVQWIHNEFHDRKAIAQCYRNDKECSDIQKKFDANVFVAGTVKDAYLNTFPELCEKDNRVLYNVIESEKIKSMAQEVIENKEELYSGQYNLISVGRLVPQKSFDRLINIIARLKNEGFDVRLLLLGSGELEEKLKKQVKELNAEDSVVFLGYQSNPYKYVRRADLFVCSSLHEGYSTAVTESLIVGTPVITTMCSGMEELLGHNNEYGVITKNTEEELYFGIRDLLNQGDIIKYYRDKAEERGKQFCITDTMKEMEIFFDEL